MDDDASAGVAEWVVTYGDMMSLLLTFFIMLVSLSELKEDKGKLRAALDAIRAAFGASLGESGATGQSLQTTSANTGLTSRGSRSEGGTKRASRDAPGSGGPHATVERINHGTVVTLGGPTVFQRYRADFSASARAALDIIGDRLAGRANQIIVRGHASPDETFPANTRDAIPSDVSDAWDLSFNRALAVAEYLVSRGIDRRRLVVSAAGTSEPRLRPRESAAQSVNRRVDVFLIDAYISHPRRTAAD